MKFSTRNITDIDQALKIGKDVSKIVDFRAAVIDLKTLRMAYSRKTLLVVGPHGAPRTKGWFFIDRKKRKLTRVAYAVAQRANYYNKLYINQGAVDAAKSGKPLVLIPYFCRDGIAVSAVIWHEHTAKLLTV